MSTSMMKLQHPPRCSDRRVAGAEVRAIGAVGQAVGSYICSSRMQGCKDAASTCAENGST